MTRSLLLAVFLLALLPCAQAQDQDSAPELRFDPALAAAEAQRWLEVLRRGEASERQEAMRRLAALGGKARAVLEGARNDPDPDVRFNVLLLLNAPSGTLDRWLRDVVIGETANAPLTPKALQAYQRIVDWESDLTPLMVRLILSRARTLGPRERSLRDRTIVVALSALRDHYRDLPSGRAVGKAQAQQLVGLLDIDLGAGFPELVTVLRALPPSAVIEALAAQARGGRREAKARAARVLAEVATPETAEKEAAPIAFELLGAREPAVRLAALECLDMLPLGADALLPIVQRVQDKDPRVRTVALRIAGERRLQVVREQAESIAGDDDQPLLARKAALRALGLLGEGSPRLLRGLARGPKQDLAALAAWALGCQGKAEGRDLILGMLGDDAFGRDERLYFGLARVGGDTAAAALAGLLAIRPGAPPDRAKRPLAIRALGFVRGEQASAARVLRELATRPAVDSARPGPTTNEIKGALESLAELGGPGARDALAQVLVLPRRAQELNVSVPLVLQVGGPEDGTTRQRLSQVLESLVRNSADRGTAAHALARIDPTRALQVLRSELRRVGRSDTARELARALARAGDTGEIARRALPYSRERMQAVGAELRSELLNAVGIDLLYAGRTDEAVAEFQRMLWCRPSDQIAAYNMACGYSLQGQVEPALHYLRRAVMLGYRKHRHIRSDTDLSKLHGEPRFERLVEQLRLAEETQLFSERGFFGWEVAD